MQNEISFWIFLLTAMKRKFLLKSKATKGKPSGFIKVIASIRLLVLALYRNQNRISIILVNNFWNFQVSKTLFMAIPMSSFLQTSLGPWD